MNDYSIELSATRIVDTRTKRYFDEVFACYSAGHYRSAVVMLWSVVVADLLFKADQLANAYGDPCAKAILPDIEAKKAKEPKSSAWESELVTDMCSKTGLLDGAAVVSLVGLQTHRHLSAHPVITNDETLFAPSREIARAHIRTALDEVLTKPPIMSRKIFDRFIVDVEQLAKLRPGADALKNFLESKYLKYFSHQSLEGVFKSLWRVTLRSDDVQAQANRETNGEVLRVLLAARKSALLEVIKGNPAWFSDVSNAPQCIGVAIKLFHDHPDVFHLLTDAVKVPLKAFADQSLDQFVQCWFVSASVDEAVELISKRVQAGESLRAEFLSRFLSVVKTADAIDKALLVGIDLYFRSGNFDTADMRFTALIEPFITLYQRKHVEQFLNGCETCQRGQATGRGAAAADHGKIALLISTKHAGIDVDKFPAFKKSIGYPEDASPAKK
jgi:hypothetical protein